MALIDRDEIERLATLARLRLDDAEVARYTADLADILGYAAELLAVVQAAPAAAGPAPAEATACPLRADTPAGGLEAAAALAAAPSARDGQFVVPRVVTH